MANRDTVCAYIAGIMDGEGTFYMGYHKVKSQGKMKDVWSTRASCVNTSLDVLEFIKSKYGGSISARKTIRNRKPIYCWNLSGPKLDRFLREIGPYLIIKKEQASLTLEMRSRLGNNKSRQGLGFIETAERLTLIQKNKELNQGLVGMT